MLLDYLFLPAIALIGLITAYQDFRYGKIKNQWILLGLIWGAGVYGFLLFLGLMNYSAISSSYIFNVFINGIVALLVGYLFWYFNLWSAGDAKLFFVFAFLLPLKYYQRGYLPYFPSFALLINVFVPAAAYLAARNLFLAVAALLRAKISFRQAIVRLKSEYPTFLKIVFGFFLTFIFFQIFRMGIGGWLEQYDERWSIFILLAALAGLKFLRKIFGKTWILILLFLVAVFYLIAAGFSGTEEKTAMLLSIAKNSLVFTAVFAFISALLAYEADERHKTMPFAVWLFLGAIITIILKSSLISFVLP